MLLLFASGLLLIFYGGGLLVSAAIRFGKITGWSSVIIGATVVSVATSAPEIFISVLAVVRGNHGIAVGNAIGTIIANLALVMGLYIIFSKRPVLGRSARLESLFMVAVFLTLVLISLNQVISVVESLALISVFFAYIVLTYRKARRTCMRTGVVNSEICAKNCECKTIAKGATGAINIAGMTTIVSATGTMRAIGRARSSKKEVTKLVCGFVAGQAFLIVGALLLVNNGERIADILGISQTVIGFTIIAFGTASPELVTVIQSARQREAGIGFGNLVGANIINGTLLLGLGGVIAGLGGPSIVLPLSTVLFVLPLLLLLGLFIVVPMFAWGGTKRWQGYVLVAVYVLYLVYLFLTGRSQ